MKVHFHYVAGFPLGTGESDYRPLWLEMLQQPGLDGWTPAGSPEDADLVAVLESGQFKCRRHREVLLRDPVLCAHWEKCLTLNYEDNPAGFLPGLYANLPAARHMEGFHQAFCYLFPPAIPPEQLQMPAPAGPEPLLFSFRGAASHPVRRRLLEAYAGTKGPWAVREIDRWYDHTAEEKAAYYEEIRRSAFVLCPRGISTTTHRLFEVMAMGRCPVILSDDWVPIPGVDWDACSIRLAEDEPRLPQLLEAQRAQAQAKGRKAREVWCALFSHPARFREALARLSAMLAQRRGAPGLASEARRWRTHSFERENRWDLKSRLANAAGNFLQRLR